MSRFILPVTALLFFIFESIFANLFSGVMFGSDRVYVPRLIMIFIAFLAIYGSKRLGILYGFILGLCYDVVYTEILGIYTFLFPVLAYLISKSMKVLQANLLIAIFVSVFFVGILEVVVYQLNVLINFAKIGYPEFANTRLLPTLLLNLAFIVILSFPLRRMVEKYETERDSA
ncbi:rod shape-determining protein MreD [Peribacillus cavernae]|uniref:Rod shape-determining protein MreD n=1 Tax=Peribacillus cavernae TaxID=1674310 RepID=A0A433HHV4_9BACI|nr:rod shape-determining protein MreD [Peribacillus cavernae]MDQ0219370.1 rod shape-determining protein MreD [Peribacillus cavernae]RUQ27753.1 rod shape-determining protein MreD [Peribacillus cavernae]